jgi:hypothetical protein
MDPLDNLKNTFHVNLVFRESESETDSLRQLLTWLGNKANPLVDEAAVERHLRELAEREAGGRALTDLAARTGENIRILRTVGGVLRAYRGLATYELGPIGVSVDILNAGDELGVAGILPSPVAEIFAVSGADPTGNPLRGLLPDLVTELPVRCGFGGYSSFTARYIRALRRVKRKAPSDPAQVLWPLGFARWDVDAGILESLPVRHLERVEDGLLIQVFNGLVTGSHPQYSEAARMLGLACVWDL